MAIKDVKKYYYAMQAQYLEMKADLADFEQALADGHITEDQLVVVKEDFEAVELNYNRLSYIMFLFNMPNKKAKQKKYLKANAKALANFEENLADKASVENENAVTIDHLKGELENLKGEN